jgi:tRNA1Val (adenine37-N6)-methyltransferase
MADGVFKFKQFDVDQSGCAMKINTDGVLLGALVSADNPKSILDIGAGTGVIALMLAQRFPEGKIDAIEIDQSAATTAGNNFSNSPFANRLNMFPESFEKYFELNPGKKYDLVVSNPPFYINSLKSPQKERQLAKHADHQFFEKLVKYLPGHLTDKGECNIILPADTAGLVKGLAFKVDLFVRRIISIHSYDDVQPHRELLTLAKGKSNEYLEKFTIYNAPKVFSEQYINSLKDFFTIF